MGNRPVVKNGGVRVVGIKEIVMKLSPEEVLRLTRILIDEDREDGMLFLKQCLKPQLDIAIRVR